jgi:phenylalanyl-tRNA synthetase beta subunit
MTLGTHTAARIGQLHPQEAERWKFRRPVYLAELFLDVLFAQPLRPPRARALSRYPAVHRDFSVVLPDSALFEAVRSEITEAGIAIIAVEP